MLHPSVSAQVAPPRECHPAELAREVSAGAVEELVRRSSSGAGELGAAFAACSLSEVRAQVGGHGAPGSAALLADGTRQFSSPLGAFELVLVHVVGHKFAGIPEEELTLAAVVHCIRARRPDRPQTPSLLRDMKTRF